MSAKPDEASRRPAPPRSTGPTLPAARSSRSEGQRFQRVLQGLLRKGPSQPETIAASQARHGAVGREEPEESQEHAQKRTDATASNVPDVTPSVRDRGTHGSPAPSLARDSAFFSPLLEQAIVGAVAQQDCTWPSDLARAVALLCARSDPSMDSWVVTLPLDSERLPHTELRLAFSHRSLSLRFCTQSRHAWELVSAQRDHLRQLLTSALPDVQDLEIDFA